MKAFWESKFGKIVLSIFIPLVVAGITSLISYFVFAERVDVSVHHFQLNITPTKHIYIIKLTNNSQGSIFNMELLIKTRSRVHHSNFDGRNTTHLSLPLVQLHTLGGTTEVDNSILIETISITSNSGNNLSELNNTSNNYSGVVSTNEIKLEPYLYDLSLGIFSLKKSQSKIATISLDLELNVDDITTASIKNVFSPREINEYPSDIMNSILIPLSSASGSLTNKIFVEGVGQSKASILEQSKIDSRNKALANLYVEIAQKIYGIHVNGLNQYSIEDIGQGYESTVSYSYSSTTRITTKGFIDLQSIVIYKEIYKDMQGGGILCILKAFYKLPWQIAENIIVEQNYVAKQISEPLEEEGSVPSWALNRPIDANSLYAVGIGSKAHDRSIASKIAINQAYAEMAAGIESQISSLTKYFESEIGKSSDDSIENYFSSVSKMIVSTSLKGVLVRKLHYSDSGEVYALVELPQDIILEQYKAALKKEESLYRLFKAESAFERLERELARDLGDWLEVNKSN
ncbi:MAG: LPP20 family lipoprotein [Candidatus Marinimicrobia bacterium]|nr:LPP20 family lipoprotein [Candidatus Neomarinimicrobiota bacterium]